MKKAPCGEELTGIFFCGVRARGVQNCPQSLPAPGFTREFGDFPYIAAHPLPVKFKTWKESLLQP
jgi:hypothetical protein